MFFTSHLFFLRIILFKNKTVICHLSLTSNTIYSKYQYPIYHNAHYSFFENTESRSHRVFIYLSVPSYNLIFFSVTLCLCVHISFSVFKYKSYSRHLFYSFHGFEFFDQGFESRCVVDVNNKISAEETVVAVDADTSQRELFVLTDDARQIVDNADVVVAHNAQCDRVH